MSLTGEQLQQLEKVLQDRFFEFFPEKPGLSDERRKEEKVNRLSKSLSAFTLAQITGIEFSEAASWVIDDHDDNGIDAIYLDDSKDIAELIFIQSKFKVGTEPDLTETLKFRKGVEDFTKENYNRFNEKLQAKLPGLLQKLEKEDVEHLIIFTHLGGNIAIHSMNEINELVDGLKLIRNGCRFENWNGERNYESLRLEHKPNVITDAIELLNWIIVDEKPRMLYGQASINELLRLYDSYGRNLFFKNIRNYIGLSEVNKSIAETLKSEPHRLIHLNNGITVICKTARPRTRNQLKSIIDITGLSVVNGAQTVGTIARVLSEIDESIDAKVFLTVIESEDTESGFEDLVTQARNTQNGVRITDFAAQDLNQERLRRELAVSGIEYFFKLGESRPASTDASNLSLEEVSVALACFSGNLADAVIAKRNSIELTDRKSEVYKRLFSERLTGMKLYRLYVVFRFLNNIADETERTSATPEEKIFYRHMRYFVFQFIKRRLSAILDRNEQTLSDSDKQELSRAFNQIGEKARELCDVYEQGYLAISRNNGTCQDLANRLQQALQPPVATSNPNGTSMLES
jgi:hypothetical protein